MTSEELDQLREMNSNYFDSLQQGLDSGILSMQEVLAKSTLKKEEIVKYHEKKHKISQGPDGRWRTYLPDGSPKGKLVAKSKRKDLEKAIVAFYRKQENEVDTLRSLYPKFLERKRLEKVRCTTIARYRNDWDRFLEDDHELADADLRKLTRGVYRDWMLRLLDTYPMKYKAYSNLKTLIMGIIDYAADMEIIPDNTFRSIKFSTNCFIAQNADIDEEQQVYNEEELQAVTNQLWNQYEGNPSYTVPLAALFTCQSGVRPCELEALRFSDLDEDGFLHVQREQVRELDDDGKFIEFEVVERTKSQSRKQPIYITELGRTILEIDKMANEENGYTGDYIFYSKNKQCLITTNMINSCLERACRAVGIPEKRIYKIRKTFGTRLANNCVSLTVMTAMMGHANPETTYRYYVRNNKTRNVMAEQVEEALHDESVIPCNTFLEKLKARNSA